MTNAHCKISIIIPAYNEEENISKLIHHLRFIFSNNKSFEIILSDGHSTDKTIEKAKEAGATVVVSPVKGRAAQMNFGAINATGDVFYFLHADTYPPHSLPHDIAKAIKRGYSCGCYQLSFDYNHWFLKLNCWFTRFNIDQFRFGDQSLFVTKEVFEIAGKFNESLIIMEDQEIISRIRKHGSFIVFNKSVKTSARKYLQNGIFKLQGIFFIIYLSYKFGVKQDKLVKIYKRLIR